MTAEEFAKLSKHEQDLLIAKMGDVQEAAKKIADQELGLSKLTMGEFEDKMKGIMEKLIKGMTPVDRKHFMFPGVGTDLQDDLSAQGKFAKTKRFFNALIGKDAKVLNAMHSEVATKANLS